MRKTLRARPIGRQLLCASAALWFAPAVCAAQVDGAATVQPGEAGQPIVDERPSDIVVTAPRLAGQLDTEITAEAELDEAAIASYGASSAAELLAALAPQTRSGRGRGGGQPIVLVNGRRISGFREIASLPAEAIAKVEIFPEEVALQYGYAADERVVNFVLKPDFRSIALETEAALPTQGGRSRGKIEPSLLRISPNGRVNLTGTYETQSLLTESERGLVPFTGNLADGEARSLLPDTERFVLDATVQRAFDKLTDGTLTARFEESHSRSLLGPGIGGPTDPLVRNSRSRTMATGASANGMAGKWRWSVSANYGDADALTFTDRTIGVRDRFDGSQQSFGANANASGKLVEGWAGPARLSLTGGYSGLRFDSRSLRGGTVAVADLQRDSVSGFGSLSIPILDPDYSVGNIGRVALNFSGSVQSLSDFSTLVSWVGGVNWGVTTKLSLLASYSRDEAAPGIQQLGAAPQLTPNVTYFDLSRGETVQIDTVTGGNPLLRAEQRRDLKLGLNWNPVQDLSFSINYNRNRSDDTSNGFPLLTPSVEAAFAGRVTRDASGRLTRLDLRPVNFARTSNSLLRWGINFGRGGPPPGAPGASRGPGGPPRGASPAAGTPAVNAPTGTAPTGTAPTGTAATGSAPAPLAPPRSGGGGGGRPGMGHFMGGGAGGGKRWQVSLYHTMKFADRIVIGPGVPEIDLLNGGAVGNDGGSPRHTVEIDAGRFDNGVGMRVGARYDSGSRVDGGIGGSDLRFGDLATFNLRGFFNFDSRPKLVKAAPWLKGFRLRVSVDNLFDAQRRVTDAGGLVPLRYQPGYLDPQGRTVEINLRKTF